MPKLALVLLIFLGLVGCASTSQVQMAVPELAVSGGAKLTDIPLTVPSYIDPVIDLATPDVPGYKTEDHFSAYFSCGWMGSLDHQAQARRILEEAKVRLEIVGSYEKWTPIEGDSRRYYIYKVW
ncbi:hypothetical protein QWI17_08175 [Gilvimarinus sp. SDUM040013]|uniref:Lipoprotein n=1 Tax=Gilvimarinus gilvus TaxID=3058038 RepID=A0ABU4S0K0_9GAMM|nr:hypothetical protein [Gilvimarinus sp. SDUM040013]MDO3385811.1 hypothetical protein [Gilvimarinus sp. SDUM040013]MDX6850627.1 hypothetical protein [Gilvimarinus sp. SDUM040013]